MLIEASATLGTAELTVVAPCYNEEKNIIPLIDKLTAALRGVEWEVVFVDDNSPDGTSAKIRALAHTNGEEVCPANWPARTFDGRDRGDAERVQRPISP